ncbi:MAG: ABC transporter substrate-binding protein, partial [Oscillibacter sp.]|nr:ABC transporter substrate-binding protein [Oscillibacter sp.]
VKFHNGQDVTAEDAAWSIVRCRDAEESGVLKVEAFSAIADVTAPDSSTLVITLSEPSNEFLSYLTCAVLPADYAEQDTAPVGTGPFRFVSRSAQENVVLERFDGYWGEPAKLEKVVYRIIENADSIMMSLQSGAVDLFAHLTITQAEQLPEDFHVEQGAMNLVQALYLNNDAAPFDDVRVRQALCYAVDKQGVLDYAFSGYGFPIGSSMYPAFAKYFDDTLTDYYPHDPARARDLLADAGYPGGFSMTITVPSNYQPHVDTAQVLVEQLKEIGVQAEIQPVEWGTWVSDVYTGRNYQSTVIGVDASDMTARALLERFVSTAGNNFINYRSDNYDELFAKAQASYDDAEQTAYYRRMEADLTANAANVYIQDMADLVAVRNGLEGLRFYPIYVLDVSGLEWVD